MSQQKSTAKILGERRGLREGLGVRSHAATLEVRPCEDEFDGVYAKRPSCRKRTQVEPVENASTSSGEMRGEESGSFQGRKEGIGRQEVSCSIGGVVMT